MKALTLSGALGLLLSSGLVFAESPALLSFQRDSGLSITGTEGTVYAIQTSTDLSQPSSWSLLAQVTATGTPYVVPGTLPSGAGSRFFRAVIVVGNMVHIAAGTFQLGSPSNEVDRFSNEGPQTTVTITKSFSIAPFPVTQQEYQSVMGTNPSLFAGDPSRPVEQVSWFDASNYCRTLTAQDLAARRIPAGWQYRLPTEAEWEYACRAGTSTRFSFGNDPDYVNLGDYAWYIDNSEFWTREVGQKLPNPWGLYDMHGNVWEWCQDWFGPHTGGASTDPHGPASGSYRVLRGGSWADYDFWCRSACRIGDDPTSRTHNGYGFRVVLAQSP